MFEISLLLFAIVLTLVVSFVLPPLWENPSLYSRQYDPNEIATSNMNQSGWPLPFRGSYTVMTNEKTIPSGTFDFAAAIVDVGLVYLAVRLTAVLIQRRKS